MRSRTQGRTLPLRVAPYDGESLSSWLAAIAARLQTPWYVLLNTLLPRTPTDTHGQRLIRLDEFAPARQLASIAMATGVDELRVAAMTLAGRHLRAVHADTASGRVSTPWGRPAPFRRYCPACLEQTDGRWSLQWRLPWVTVCVEHACLLHDRCAVCGRKQYDAPGCFSDRHPPRPRMCCCTADLSQAPLRAGPVDATMLDAQRALNAMVAADATTTGIYAGTMVSSAQLLADIRRLANRAVNTATPNSVSTAFDIDRRKEAQRWLKRLWRNESRGNPASIRFATNASTAVVAVGTLAALHIIEQPTLEHAAAALTSLAPLGRGNPIYPGNSYRGYRPSAPLCAVEVIAQSAHWDSLEKLRFRVHSPLPRRLDPPGITEKMMPNIPTLMWIPWAAALDVLDHHLAWPTYRQTLSWLMLEIGARPCERAIRDGLRATNERKRVREFAEAMSRDPRWPRVAEALIALHAHLVSDPAPIDYQRRRELDYRDLLSTEQWHELWKYAEALHPRPAPVHYARIWLYERLSGMPAGTRSAIPREQYTVDRFLLRLTPDLKRALDVHAAQFLAQHGITDEPVVWTPPLCVLGDHTFKPPFDHLSVPKLHALLRSGRCTVAQAARELDTPLHVIRHLLEEHPMPPRTAERRTWKQQLATALSDEELARLYRDGLTFNDIGRRYGIPEGHVAQRARECGIPPHRPAREPIPAAWIREHHIGRGQTIGEMAAELGDTYSRVRYWAEAHQIPIRRYYRRVQNEEVLRYARKLGVQDLLEPLLLDKNGWNRLQRFAITSTHRNIAAAAHAIGCSRDTLCLQVIGLENALGFRLIERSTSRYKPMTITAQGNDLAVAVLRIAHHMESRKGRP